MNNTVEKHYQNWLDRWRTLWLVFRTFDRCADLQRLIRWAQGKKLPGPLRLYQSQLLEAEGKLTRYTIQNPGFVTKAYLLYRLYRLLYPTPRCYPKGSAAKYRTLRDQSIPPTLTMLRT